MIRLVVLSLAACGSASQPPATQPTTPPRVIDDSVHRAELTAAHHKLEEQQQDALAATCNDTGKHERCLPSCYVGEPLDPRATKRPPPSVVIEHLACEKRDGDGSGPFVLADELDKTTVRAARQFPRPHKSGTWQAAVEAALAPLARGKRGDVIAVTGAWRDVEHPITHDKLRCATVGHYARGLRTIDGCGGDGNVGCEAGGDPAVHGINVVHYRLAEAERLRAAGKSADCQQAALEAVAVARGMPRWRQYMQLNVAKWSQFAAYRTRFDGVLDEDALFVAATALGKQAEAIYTACGGAAGAPTTPAQEQSFHTCW